MTVRILVGDTRAVLPSLPSQSFHVAITSPPYYGLRDYGTAVWDGGDPSCSHGVVRWEGPKQTQGAQSGHSSKTNLLNRRTCACGAVRIDSQTGLESSPDEYVTGLVSVFREVRRVLRDDGTLWLNLGDSYANDRKWGGRSGGKHAKALHGNSGIGRQKVTTGLKPKDLIGIPWRVAFALQEDGWHLRSDIIEEVELYCPCGCGYVLEERVWRHAPDREIVWHKPNAMPESVKDRPTKSHEYVFLFSKSPTYYYDSASVMERAVDPEYRAGRRARKSDHIQDDSGYDDRRTRMSLLGAQKPRSVRNRRSVWTIATKPYKGAHFATFPPALVEPCVLAGAPAGGYVLDPFGGAGTVGLVASRLGRNATLVELNPKFAEMARARIADEAPMFADVTIEAP